MAAHIDEGIADLILDCWRLELKTYNSCEYNLDRVWIEFEMESAKKFLNIVCRHSIKLAQAVQKACGNDDMWDYDGITCNKALKKDVVWPPDIELTLSVRFPVKHLPDVKAVIHEFAENPSRPCCPVIIEGLNDKVQNLIGRDPR